MIKKVVFIVMSFSITNLHAAQMHKKQQTERALLANDESTPSEGARKFLDNPHIQKAGIFLLICCAALAEGHLLKPIQILKR